MVPAPVDAADQAPDVRIAAALPRRMHVGSVLLIDATLVNCAEAPLASAAPHPLSICYRWHDPADETLVLEGQRAPLRTVLAPGASLQRTVELLVPERAGELVLVLTLVREGVSWLDEGDRNALVTHVELVDDGSGADLDAQLCARFPPPWRPFAEAYPIVHGRFLDYALELRPLRELFRSGADLPRCFGAGLDERVVEYPWLLSQRLGGRVLDAGSALNNSRMLDSLLPRVSELHIVTLRPERQAAWQRGVSYTFADVRELPYRDDLFAVVACVSTLEHVGMDNRAYGDDRPPAADADAERLRAASELWRVVKPGGSLLITVPCGRYADHGWFATLDVARLEAIAGRLCPEAFTIELFRVGRDGWRRAPASAVSGLVSRDSRREPVDRDGAVAARAVACVRLTKSAGPHGC